MTTKKVSVIGLGMMGSTLARLLLKNGYKVTVWNRSAGKKEILIKEGARAAETAVDAVLWADVIVMCVHDYKAIDNILQNKEVEVVIKGKLLVQFTTGGPQDARHYAEWTQKHGADYLDAAIQVAPAQMGRADTPILIAGSEAVYQSHEKLLKVFGGGYTWLGNDAGAANALDLATLTALYGAIIGFFQGARVCEAEGFDVARYGAIIRDIMPTFGDFLFHEGNAIAQNDFSVSESPLRISVEATQRILQYAREKQIHTAYPALMANLLSEADKAGYAGQELAAVVKLLR